MKKYLHYILPILIVTGVTLEQLDILHVSYLYIKSHELKWTDLDYGYHNQEEDVYTTGESVSQNNYEDGLIALQPDYKQLLDRDLKEISDNRDQIDLIDSEELTFFSDEYMIKACIDQKDISINDSTLFKKLVNVEIVGGYELYDKEGSELLYHKENEKFWIRNQIVMRGYARRPFIDNKIEEIVLAQMSNNAHLIIPQYETPYMFSEHLQAIDAYKTLQGPFFTSRDTIKINKWSDIYGNLDYTDNLSDIFKHVGEESKNKP